MVVTVFPRAARGGKSECMSTFQVSLVSYCPTGQSKSRGEAQSQWKREFTKGIDMGREFVWGLLQIIHHGAQSQNDNV